MAVTASVQLGAPESRSSPEGVASPLMVADDAIVIDTSDMTIDEIVADVVQRL